MSNCGGDWKLIIFYCDEPAVEREPFWQLGGDYYYCYQNFMTYTFVSILCRISGQDIVQHYGYDSFSLFFSSFFWVGGGGVTDNADVW